MALETGTYIEDLVVTNPVTPDQKTQGDDHLRLIKSVLKNTFKRATRSFYFPQVVTKSSAYTVLSTEDNTTFLCDTTTGFVLTLPILTTDDAGWQIKVIKTTSDANAVLITPPSGTINGRSAARRSVTGQQTEVVWTGAEFVASRPNGPPIGTISTFYGSSLPQGHLWANGGAINSTTMPEAFAVLGANTPNLGERIEVGKSNMGGVTPAGALTTTIDATTLGAVGGQEFETQHTHSVSGNTGSENVGHTHTEGGSSTGAQAGSSFAAVVAGGQTGNESTVHQHDVSLTSGLSTTGLSNVQPSIVVNKIVVIE